MVHLERALQDHFANLQRAQSNAFVTNGNASSHRPTAADTSMTDASSLATPFAKVNSVAPGGPADQAGLQAGDKIRSFGNVNWMNHARLSKIAEAVQRNEGVCHYRRCSRPLFLTSNAADLTSEGR